MRLAVMFHRLRVIAAFEPAARDQVMHHRLLIRPAATLRNGQRQAAARRYLRGAAFFQQQHGIGQITAEQQTVGIGVGLLLRGLVHDLHAINPILNQPDVSRIRGIQRLPDRLFNGVDQ